MSRTESQENYLETILLLGRKKPAVRAVDIANELGFSKPSVSLALKNLVKSDLVVVSPEGYITFTTEGREIAEAIYERHEIVTEMLIHIGVPADIAEEDACRIEHVISETTFEAIKKHGCR